jgi:hypothetical protein
MKINELSMNQAEKQENYAETVALEQKPTTFAAPISKEGGF